MISGYIRATSISSDDGRSAIAGARSALLAGARSAVVPALAEAADSAAQRFQDPLAARFAYAVQAGELPADLDAEHEAARLRVLLDGLAVELITAPKQTSASWALGVLDDHFAALTRGG